MKYELIHHSCEKYDHETLPAADFSKIMGSVFVQIVNVNWMNEAIRAENKLAMLETEIKNLNLLKSVCENEPE